MQTVPGQGGNTVTNNLDEVAADERAARLRAEADSLEQNQGPVATGTAHAKAVQGVAAEDAAIAADVAPILPAFEKLGTSVSGGPDAVQDTYNQWFSHNPAEDEGFRRARALGKVREGHDGAQGDATTLAATVQVVTETLREKSIPTHELDPGDQTLIRDEIRMLLDSTPPHELTTAMLRLLEATDVSDPIVSVLAGRFGKSYSASRGTPDAHDAFREMLIARAAEHGEGSQKVAARALHKMKETGLTAWADPAASRGLVGAVYSQLPRELRDAIQ